jgi:hypothetical protein
VRSDAFYAATARQIAREFAGLPPGHGLDGAPPLPPSPLPLVRADEIHWEMAPAETIPSKGGNLRASTIGYREVAQAGCHALHELQQQHDRLVEQQHRLHDELRALRPTVPPTSPDTPVPTRQPRLPIASLSGVQGVRGVRGL